MKAIQRITATELTQGASRGKKSWHDMYSGSAYVFVGIATVYISLSDMYNYTQNEFTLCLDTYAICFPTGGLNYELTEGDILAVFSQ